MSNENTAMETLVCEHCDTLIAVDEREVLIDSDIRDNQFVYFKVCVCPICDKITAV